MSVVALLCFVIALVAIAVSIRNVEFLNVLTDDTTVASDAPNVWWLLVAVAFLIAFVVFGIGAVFKSGLA